MNCDSPKQINSHVKIEDDTKVEKDEIPNTLLDKIEDIELMYYGMMCDCPQWATSKDIKLYTSLIENGNSIPMDSLFINVVPSDENLKNPFELEYNSLNPEFIFTGSFFKNKVKWIADDGMVYNNRVFQYSKCIVKK